MKIIAVCTGKIRTYKWNEKDVATAILKQPIDTPVTVKSQGLVGDEQADLKVHGGQDKAVYAYSADTFEFWQETLNRKTIQFGEFGENLSIDHLDEKSIFVGDTFAIGSCILQAVQPRQPCYKLDIIFKHPMVEKFNQHNRCGIYFRVLQEGIIQRGDSFKLIGSEEVKASIEELFQIYKNKGQVEKLRAQELASIPSMNEKWRSKFASFK
jgi:MOSC domain-containing protein YiiM